MSVVIMTQAEWESKGEALFGQDRFQWEFVCPSCGHVQKPEDFRQYKEAGAHPHMAYCECIGRWCKSSRSAFEDVGQGPCDYASYGLFNICPVQVRMPDATIVNVFAFKENK